MKIERCYDSHVHLFATGEQLSGLDLSQLKNPNDVSLLHVLPQHRRGEWILGFGWDQHRWSNHDFPTTQELDKVFPVTPVNFTRADGHASWLNSEALRRLGYFQKTETEKPTPPGGLILRDSQGFPSGIFIDQAKISADLQISQSDESEKLHFLKAAIKYFNSRGFTHIRDMSCNLDQWKILRQLDAKKELTLYIEENFTCEDLSDLPRALREYKEAQAMQSPHLRAGAIKIYCDGALGSEGALLSKNYLQRTHNGLRIWKLADIETMAQEVFRAGAPLAIHTIGDQASEEISDLFVKLQKAGIQGQLHFEHLELASQQTLRNLKQLNARVHFQPCHFLTDRAFLKDKLGELYSRVFRWRQAEDMGIPFCFGSDAPIEPASLPANLLALKLAVNESIPAPKQLGQFYHQHPDIQWGPSCFSIYEGDSVKQICFDGADLKF